VNRIGRIWQDGSISNGRENVLMKSITILDSGVSRELVALGAELGLPE